MDSLKQTGPPPIPHITTNIIPLSTILRKFSEFSYAELSHVIRTHPNDDAKKKRLLELIVYLRQEFIRLYVLTKWSKISAKDFNKFIDLLAWLREQTSHFTNLIWSTKSLNQSLLSAKLPNPDLITALEVLTNGRPTLPSHNFIETKISAKKIQETLKELNIILSMKLALVDELPSGFTDFEIKDGRIVITTADYSFQISAIDENSPFFMIDFEFKLGDFQPGRNLIKVCNETLRTSGFEDLKKVLTNYTNTMKLYLIHHKLNELKNIKHVYQADRFQIVVHYWINSYVFKNSYIRIGLNRNNKIMFKWFRQGEFIQQFEDVEHVDLFLKDIYYKHSTFILDQINDLTINKSILQINELTGLFYFKNPTPSLNNSLKKLNVDDFSKINENMDALKLDIKLQEASTILSVTGWIQNDLIKLQPSEIKKLPGVNESKILSSSKNVKFYTRKEWPFNWFLILYIDTKIQTYIANVKPSLGQWSISNAADLKIEEFDYKNSKQIINYVSKKIVVHLISKELTGCDYTVVQDDTIIIRTNTFIDIPGAASLLFLRFKMESDKTMLIKLKGKLNDDVKLEDFKIDKDGIFDIFETVEFKRVSVLSNIIDKLGKLAKIIGLVKYLKQSKMNLLNVKLDEISFTYGNEQVCTIKENLEIELPKNNPHNICFSFIKRYLNEQGIKKLFDHLQNTNQLVTKLSSMQSKSADQNFVNYEVDKLRFEVIARSCNMFSILYYNMNALNKVIDLKLNLTHNPKGTGFDYVFSYKSDDEKAIEFFKNEFNFKSDLVKRFSSQFKIIPLTDALLTDETGVNVLIDFFHEIIMSEFSSLNK